MQEYWKPIEGFENYEVSNIGNIKSLNYNKTGEKRILKPCKTRIGYLKVGLLKNGKKYTKLVHRLVAQAFIPNPENKPQVNHIDGNKQNNAISNLEWCTPKENQQHAWNTELHKPLKGENAPMYGKHHTEKAKNKISEALKGKYIGEKNPMYGKHITEEHKKKLSKIFKGSKHPQAKKIRCITTNEIFGSTTEASEKYNVARPNITKCCRGDRKSAGKHPDTGEKLIWEYLKEKIK